MKYEDALARPATPGPVRARRAEAEREPTEAELHTILERKFPAKMLQTEKMAALGQLVSGIAHELNNPLTAIMGYTQLLLGRGLGPGPLSEARKVYQEAERARRIVKNLLYFARENRPEQTRVDLNEIVERTLALRSYEMKVENIVVECELALDLPRTMADPYQLQQVVLNLVINAEQALLEGRGQGRVRIRTEHLTRTRGDRILLEVSDDGPGIPHDIAWRIFDPFFTTKPAGVGTGLGLSIVYGIVHQHGGEVTFESQPGNGAKFSVELPVVSAAAGEPEDALAQDAGAAQAVLTGRILVVEDEPTVAQLMADVLREEGHEVEAVLDSQEGLTRLSRSRYDLVVCDLRMPRLDGPAFYDALVRGGSVMQRRIIFVTGDTAAPRTPEFLARHDLPYLAKPFLVEELKLAVHRALERGQTDEKASDASPRPKSRSAHKGT
ncbi:MAG: ATP-binding protein [Candidatus Acidiferrales bacterium]